MVQISVNSTDLFMNGSAIEFVPSINKKATFCFLDFSIQFELSDYYVYTSQKTE